MARMIPTYENDGDFYALNGGRRGNSGPRQGLDAELAMYRALKALPDDFTVLHSWGFTRNPQDGGPMEKGEADFVVLGPQGVLVIEVKSMAMAFKDGRWFAVNNPGRTRPSPFEQADKELDGVIQRLKGMKHGTGGGRDIIWRGPHAHVLCESAVAFPKNHYEGMSLPGGRSACTLIDWASLSKDGAAEMVNRLFAYRRGFQDESFFTGLTAGEIQQAAEILLPALRPLASDGPAIEATHRELDRISRGLEIRSDYGDRNRWGRFTILEGGSGTGKTLLAQHWARQAAQEGKRTLLLCFNKLLSDFLRKEQAKAQDQAGFDIFTFHALAQRRAQSADLPNRVPPASREEQSAFYEYRSPQMLLEATEKLKAERGTSDFYDVVIVDEAQDIRRAWWPVVLAQLADPDRGEMHLLKDDAQALYGRETGLPDEMRAHFTNSDHLTCCFRNTRSILNFIAQTTGRKLMPASEVPDGMWPEVEESGCCVTEKLASLLTRLREQDGIGLNQIAVLCDHNYLSEGCVLNGCGGRIGGVPIIDPKQCGYDLVGAWQAGKGLLVITPRSFKGLEADVVILAGMKSFRDSFQEADLYVALSRARSRLFALCENGEVLDCLFRGKAHLGDS